MLQILQNALIPALLAGISLYALCKGVDVFPTLLRGAAVGLKTAVQIPVSYRHLSAGYRADADRAERNLNSADSVYGGGGSCGLRSTRAI